MGPRSKLDLSVIGEAWKLVQAQLSTWILATLLAALIMGSEASRVLHRASIPVLVFRALMSADHPDKTPPKRKA